MSPFPCLGEMLALGSSLAWAVGVIFFRRAGETVHPLALNFFKNSFSLLLLALSWMVLGHSLFARVPSRDVWLLVGAGIVGLGISDTFLLASLNRLGAGLIAILWTLYTPMVIGFSMGMLGERLGIIQWLGVVMIAAALMMVTRIEKEISRDRRASLWIGILWSVIAMITQAVSVVAIKPVLERTPTIVATELRLIGGLLFLIPVLLLRRDRRANIASLVRWENLKVLLPGSFSGTYLALTLMLGGVKYTLASTATALNQTSNLFIFLLAVLLLGESAGVKRVAGIALGVTGAVLVTLGS
ncbi:MAG: DMT family transporter [bacterium]